MPVKKVTTEKEVKPITKKVVVKATTPKSAGLSVSVYSLLGRATGDLALPKEIFGAKVNEKLLAQAMRVYMTNQKIHPGNTKTRGQVVGSTAKIYNQKGTGRARHGAITAPIFVGGGIAFGPTSRKTTLDLPKKMKAAALISALSSKVVDKNVIGVSGLGKATGKTKEFVQLLEKIATIDKKLSSVLIMVDGKADNVVRATRNILGVHVLPTNLINAYEILRHDLLLVTKEAVEKLVKPQAKETK